MVDDPFSWVFFKLKVDHNKWWFQRHKQSFDTHYYSIWNGFNNKKDEGWEKQNKTNQIKSNQRHKKRLDTHYCYSELKWVLVQKIEGWEKQNKTKQIKDIRKRFDTHYYYSELKWVLVQKIEGKNNSNQRHKKRVWHPQKFQLKWVWVQKIEEDCEKQNNFGCGREGKSCCCCCCYGFLFFFSVHFRNVYVFIGFFRRHLLLHHPCTSLQKLFLFSPNSSHSSSTESTQGFEGVFFFFWWWLLSLGVF